MPKEVTIILAVLLVITLGTAFAFRKSIREALAVWEYARTFKDSGIDENFRTLYEKQTSVKIPKAAQTLPLSENFRDDTLPETYEYDGADKNLAQFLDNTQTTGLAVFHKGDLIYEDYRRGNSRESKAIQMSVSKSMASFLIGVALEDGVIKSIDDLVTDYDATLKGSAYDGVTLRQVLEMSSGVRWDEDYGRLDSDLVQSIVAMKLGSLDDFTRRVPRENKPGSYNRYASIDTHVLAMVLRGATGKSYPEYLHEKLWSQIGSEDDAYILTDAQNTALAFGGMNIRLRDMIRFGALYLHDGKTLDGRQLVSADWIRESTIPDVPRLMPGEDNPESDSGFGYKYQWWIPFFPDELGNDFAAIGIYGQFIYINRSRDVVIAKTSAYRNYTVDGGYMNHETLIAMQAIARHLSP